VVRCGLDAMVVVSHWAWSRGVYREECARSKQGGRKMPSEVRVSHGWRVDGIFSSDPPRR
jgi:hypothetical protein